MFTHNLRLPERPIADGRWHECAAGEGQYFLFPDLLIAIFNGGSKGESPTVWRYDEHRILTRAQEQRIADAIARRPMRSPAPIKRELPMAEARAFVATDGLRRSSRCTMAVVPLRDRK